MNLAQKVAYNTGVQLFARLLVLGLGLLSLRLTATYLGVQEFGQLSIVIALTGLAATIGDLGVTTTLAREIAKTPAEATRLGGYLLRFRIGSSIAVAAVVAALLPFLPYQGSTKIAVGIALVGMVFTILGTFPAAFFQANLRLEYAAATDVLTRILGVAAIGIVRGFGLGLYALVLILAASNAIVCGVSFAFSRGFWSPNVNGSWSGGRKLIADAVAVGVVSIIGLVHFRGDAILLSLLKPARDVGIYAIAYRYIDQSFMLPGLFMATMFPVITRALHSNVRAAEQAINRTFQVLLLGAVLVVIGLFALATPLVHLVAGSSFDASVEPLRILSFSLVFIFVGPVFYNVLIALNRQRQLIVVGVASVVLNVGLNLILIPRYSYNGAAISTVVSECFSLLGCFVVARRHYDFRLDLGFIVRVAAAAGCACGVMASLDRSSAWAAFAGGEAVFVAAAYLFRAVTSAELRLVVRGTSASPGA